MHSNGSPCLPMRVWRKITGPRELMPTATATTNISGAATTKAALATTMSNTRWMASARRLLLRARSTIRASNASWVEATCGRARARTNVAGVTVEPGSATDWVVSDLSVTLVVIVIEGSLSLDLRFPAPCPTS